MFLCLFVRGVWLFKKISERMWVCVCLCVKAGWLVSWLSVPWCYLLRGADHTETIHHGATQVIIMTHSISLRSSLLILALNVVYRRIWAIYETPLFTLGGPLSFSTQAWQSGLGNLCLASLNRLPPNEPDRMTIHPQGALDVPQFKC